jgi:nucleotide-binding universal stress UspA family protein
MPLLEKADHVIFASVAEPGREDTETVSDLVRQTAWHGICASAQVIAANHQTVAEALQRAAESSRADLIVMGAYGQARWREICFGGCTQSMIDSCDRPVFLLH